MNILKDGGVVKTDRFSLDGTFLTAWPKEGYDEEIEHISYRNWHHEGRRFRHGAEMMGADYTQWHGIWELQENLVKIIEYGAEHGVPKAVKWQKSKDPDKFLNREKELGLKYELPPIHEEYMKNLKIDLKELYKKQKLELLLLR